MHALILNLNGTAVVWWQYVFRATWEASLVAVIALALLRFARRWPAPLRAAVLLVALLKFLAPPMLPSPFGIFPDVQRTAISVHQPPAPPVGPGDSFEASTPISVATPTFSPHVELNSIVQSPPAPRLTGLALLMLLHVAGSLVAACAVGIGLMRLHRLARRATPLSCGPVYERMIAVADRLKIRSPRELLLSPDPVPPMAFGVLRQVVMLPQTVVDTLAPQSLDAVLAHELAHHRRRDTLATIVQLAALITWWFNPLAWILGREFRRTREECCDDIVLAQGIAGGADYCRTILAAAEHLAAPFPLRGALAMAEPMHPLGNRMRRIMDPSLRRASHLSWLALVAVLILAVVVLPGTRLRGQQQPNISPRPAQDLSSLHVTVASAADGTPIAGATLHFRIPAHSHADAHTDAQGSVTVESLAPGSCTVEATAPGKAKVIKVINLDATADNTLTFALPEGGLVSGKVTNIRGDPIAGVGVSVHPNLVGSQIDYVKTNADGVFESDHLPLDQPLRVLFNDDFYANDWEDVSLSATQRQGTLNVVLKAKPPGSSIAGTVVDPDGKPIAQAQISYGGIGSSSQKTVNTDATGAFRLDGMQFNQLPVQIIVRANGWAPMAVDIAQLGTKDAPAQVAVRMTEKGHHITLRVVDEAGEPISSVRVTAGAVGSTLFDRLIATTTTGADGRFSSDSLPAKAPFDFIARGYSDIRWKELPIDGAGDVSVIMRRLAGIAGKAVDADSGQPVPAFNIKVLPTSTVNDPGQEFSGGRGEFHIDGLDAGTELTLVVAADGYPVQYFDHIPVTSSGQIVPAIVRLSKNPPNQIRIAGRIIDAGGKRIAGVEVRALAYMHMSDDSGYAYRFTWQMLKSGQLSHQKYIRTIEQTRTDSNGAFVFTNLPGPDVDLAYWADRVPPARLQDIGKQPADQREHMEIRLPAPATVSGRINRQAYPTDTKVALRSSTAPWLEIMQVDLKSGEDHYSFAAVPPGSYDVVVFVTPVSHEAGVFQYHVVATDPVDVKEGESRQLDLGFGNGGGPTTKPQP